MSLILASQSAILVAPSLEAKPEQNNSNVRIFATNLINKIDKKLLGVGIGLFGGGVMLGKLLAHLGKSFDSKDINGNYSNEELAKLVSENRKLLSQLPKLTSNNGRGVNDFSRLIDENVETMRQKLLSDLSERMNINTERIHHNLSELINQRNNLKENENSEKFIINKVIPFSKEILKFSKDIWSRETLLQNSVKDEIEEFKNKMERFINSMKGNVDSTKYQELRRNLILFTLKFEEKNLKDNFIEEQNLLDQINIAIESILSNSTVDSQDSSNILDDLVEAASNLNYWLDENSDVLEYSGFESLL